MAYWIDLASVNSVSANYSPRVVRLSANSLSLLYAANALLYRRDVWCSDDKFPTDVEWDEIDGILGSLYREIGASVDVSTTIEVASLEHRGATIWGGYAGADTINVRELTDVIVAQDWLSLDENVITLDPGLYLVSVSQCAWRTGLTRGVLRVTDDTVVTDYFGHWCFARSEDYPHELQVAQSCVLSSANELAVGVMMYTQFERVNNGLGFGGVEPHIYARVDVMRLAYG